MCEECFAAGYAAGSIVAMTARDEALARQLSTPNEAQHAAIPTAQAVTNVGLEFCMFGHAVLALC